MASATVHSKVVVLLIQSDPLFSVAPFVRVFPVWSLFCNAVLCVISSFVIISLRKRELAALL